MESHEWELSKENVQPLKQGRSFAQLNDALKPKSNNAIHQQQETFEQELRMYEGPDPLSIWVRYINWTEQAFPKGGCDGHYKELLEKCVQTFIKDKGYYNDLRYLKIWIKFADYNNDPGLLYEYMHNNKIGSEFADFYEEYALFLERCENTKKADSVYMFGISAAAKPLERLKKRHSEFQARVARSAIEAMKKTSSDEMEFEAVEATEPLRTTFGVLQPRGKRAEAPVNRTASGRPEKFPVSSGNQQTRTSTIQIYSDENSTSCRLPPQNQEFKSVPMPNVMQRENWQQPAKWTDARVKQKGLSSGTSHRPAAPSFVLHEDADVQQPLCTPHKVADGTGILSVRQEPSTYGTLNFFGTSEDTNPKEMAMYCKNKVYAGVSEFSFEELRALHWLKKKRQEKETEERLHLERVEEILEQEMHQDRWEPTTFGALNSNFATTEVTNQKEMIMYCKDKIFADGREFSFEELRAIHWFEKKRLENENQEILCLEMHQERRSVTAAIEPVTLTGDVQMEELHLDDPSVPLLEDSVSVQLPVVSQNRTDDVAAESITSTISDVHMATPGFPANWRKQMTPLAKDASFLLLTQPSPTVHTKEAMATIRNLFCFSQGINPVCNDPVCTDMEFENQFLLQEDGNVPPSAPFEIYQDPSFIYPGQKAQISTKQMGFDIYEDPLPSQLPNKENIPQKADFAIYEDPPMIQDKENVQSSTGFKIYEDPSKMQDKENVQSKAGFTIYEDPPKFSSNENLPPSRASLIKEDPHSISSRSVMHTTETYAGSEQPSKNLSSHQPSGTFTIYEDPCTKHPDTGKTTDGRQPLVANPTWSMPDKENMIVRRGLRPLADRDVVSSVSSAETVVPGPIAFVPVQPCETAISIGQSSEGLVSGSGCHQLQGEEKEHCFHFSEEILNELDDVEMNDVGDWNVDALDPEAEMTFNPKSSSTKNLTHLVQFVNASGFPGPQQQQLCPYGSDTGFAQQNQHPSKPSASIDSQPGNSSDTFPLNSRKSSCFFGLDTIQEGSEESKSQLGSLDSRSSSSRPSYTRSSSSSRSCSHNSGSKSSINQHLSNSSYCSANRQSATDLAEAVSSAANPFPSDEFCEPGKRTNNTFNTSQSIHGQRQRDNSEHVPKHVITQADESLVASPGPNKLMLDASVCIDHTNPYNATVIQDFLKNLSPPLSTYSNYHHVDDSLPKFTVRSKVRIGEKSYLVKAKLGEGGYAKVYHIVETTSNNDDGQSVVAKVQTPACPWEFYITTELHRRLSLNKSHIDIRPSIIYIDKAFFFFDGSCLLNQRHGRGTLLDFLNSFKLNRKSLPEWLTLFLSIELFNIVEQMHRCQIIHGDFKPENILICQPRQLMDGETAADLLTGCTSFLKLIDFGQGIDMSTFPPGTTFVSSTSTKGYQCPDMLSGRPWTYQTDLYGLIATIYVIHQGNFMKVYCANNEYSTTLTYSRSSRARDIWKEMFKVFLNIPDCTSLPSLENYRCKLEREFLELFSKEAYNSFVAEYQHC